MRRGRASERFLALARALRHNRPMEGPVDFVLPARAVPLELVAGRGHYARVVEAILQARASVWISTANLKELQVEAPATPTRRRGYRSILDELEGLRARGVELRLLHASPPSGPFREALATMPRLGAGGLPMRPCPRVHCKLVIVDGALAYLGSANFTGAGLGVRGQGKRNFELGVTTTDDAMLDALQAYFSRLWRGAECRGCKLRAHCPKPIDVLEAAPPAPAAAAAAPKKPRARRKPRAPRRPASEITASGPQKRERQGR